MNKRSNNGDTMPELVELHEQAKARVMAASNALRHGEQQLKPLRTELESAFANELNIRTRITHWQAAVFSK